MSYEDLQPEPVIEQTTLDQMLNENEGEARTGSMIVGRDFVSGNIDSVNYRSINILGLTITTASSSLFLGIDGKYHDEDEFLGVDGKYHKGYQHSLTIVDAVTTKLSALFPASVSKKDCEGIVGMICDVCRESFESGNIWRAHLTIAREITSLLWAVIYYRVEPLFKRTKIAP